MRHVSRTHRIAFDWLFDRINLDSKVQIKYIDTKNQFADILTNKFSHVMSGIICCVSLTSAISVLQSALTQWRNDLNKIQEKNESQQNRDRWWILLPGHRRSYRSSTSVSQVKRSYGSQNPWSTMAEKEEGSGRPDIGIDRKKAFDHYYHEQFMESFSSASYSKLDDDRAWSSQEWKTETTTYDRSKRPDKTFWRVVRKVRPGHEEILFEGTAQSVRNEEALRDRSADLMIPILKKRQDLKISSLETMKQNWNCL